MSYILSVLQVHITAIENVFMYFRKLYCNETVNKDCLWIVVLDPTIPYTPGADFEEAILYEHQFGNPPERYRRIARSKAKISWRTGLPSHHVIMNAPYLLVDGDTKYGGSTVTPEGLVVACSGVEWYMDQHFAETIASAIKAQSIKEMGYITDSSEYFVG